MARENTTIVLNERPTDEIILNKTFAAKTAPIPTAADLQDGQILVEVLYLSLDPAMRGWLADKRSYLPPVAVGATMRGSTVARVLASKSKLAAEGDLVSAFAGWTEYAILPDGAFEPAKSFPSFKKPQDLLSALGTTGVTAWVGMTTIGQPKAGETVVVSGAAGATGSVAGQIAKINGAKVVGIAGSEEKRKYLVEELGFDIGLNYKDPDFKKKFYEATPDHIDVYFDNVGGEILDLALSNANPKARFVECGMISQYNTSKPVGPKNIAQVVAMRIRMEGFIVLDHREKFPQARAELGKWLADGKLKTTETVVKGGIRAAEQALIDLYKGINTGKLLVEIKNPDESPSKL